MPTPEIHKKLSQWNNFKANCEVVNRLSRELVSYDFSVKDIKRINEIAKEIVEESDSIINDELGR